MKNMSVQVCDASPTKLITGNIDTREQLLLYLNFWFPEVNWIRIELDYTDFLSVFDCTLNIFCILIHGPDQLTA